METKLVSKGIADTIGKRPDRIVVIIVSLEGVGRFCCKALTPVVGGEGFVGGKFEAGVYERGAGGGLV